METCSWLIFNFKDIITLRFFSVLLYRSHFIWVHLNTLSLNCGSLLMLSFNLLLSISCFPPNYPRSFWFMIIFSKSLQILFLAVSCKNVTLTSKLLKLLSRTWPTINPVCKIFFPFWQRHIDNSFWDLLLKFVLHEPVHLL